MGLDLTGDKSDLADTHVQGVRLNHAIFASDRGVLLDWE